MSQTIATKTSSRYHNVTYLEIKQRSAQDVHWRMGLELRVYFSILPSLPSAIPLLRLRWSEIDAPPLIVLRHPVRRLGVHGEGW